MASSHTKFTQRPAGSKPVHQAVSHGVGAHALARSHHAQALRVPRLAKLQTSIAAANAKGAASSKGRK